MTWKFDPTHSHVQFSVRHMMVATVKGHFGAFSAEAELDPSNLSQSKVSATADVASISTGVDQRDAHLRSGDFFDAEKFPHMQLVTTSIKANGEDLVVEANLTIRGVTKPVTLRGELLGPVKDPWGNQRIGVQLQGELDREEFGITWNQALETGGALVGKKVKLDLGAEFTKA
ncbi:MAG TPA: YceI family protein [Polyangiaceae bacterium]|nr:YceI family protein [Polyangiaceae bacterium]